MNTIQENNKLIAEFLGYSQPHPEYQNTTYWYKKGLPPLTILSFDTDWNALMEVINKIENTNIQKLSFNFNIQKDRVSLYYTHTIEPKKQIEMWFEWGQKTKIKNTYKIVVEFIEWYNKQK